MLDGVLDDVHSNAAATLSVCFGACGKPEDIALQERGIIHGIGLQDPFGLLDP
jgi:hypothetical protein